MLLGLILGLLFVTPLVVVYAVFIRWCDRFEPEPWWLLFVAFVFGALVATLGGGLTSAIASELTRATLGLGEKDPGMEFIGTAIYAPIFEESFKGLGVLLIAAISWMGVKELDGPLDGAIYGGMVGLGFTLTEDVLYVAGAMAEHGAEGFLFLWFLRTVIGGLGHASYTAMTGLGVGFAAESRSTAVKLAGPFAGWSMAVSFHAFHNGVLAFGNIGAVFMILGTLVVDALFFLILGMLVARDRKIVMRELGEEAGSLLHPQELKLLLTYFTIGWRTWGTLFTRGWSHFRARRKKQLALVEIAFIKTRRRRGERDRGLDLKESRLRYDVAMASRMGIWLG